MIDAFRDRLGAVPRWVRRTGGLVALAALAVVILAAPVGDWWAQRNDIGEAEAHLAAIEADNRDLQERLDRIADPATVERIARRDLGLVREGEESYTILPPPTAGLVMPDTWPFNRVAASMVGAP
jgi:cell division protein FtsB